MRDVQDQINSIEQKLEKLFNYQDKVVTDNLKLEEENRALKEELKQNKRKIVEMQNSINLLKKAKGVALSNDQQKDLDKMLDTYIKEIDQCIATLSKQ